MRNEEKENEQSNLSRREMVKLTAGAIVIPALPQPKKRVVQSPSQQLNKPANKPASKSPRFFTAAELAMVDELAELIIPTDRHSPGARAARAAEFIDQTLVEVLEDELRRQWRVGLKLIDALSVEMHGITLMQASVEQRIVTLERIARGESDPKTPEEKFFVELKSRVAHAYYTSKIGLRDELEYKGNSYLREFAGTDVSQS